MPKISKLLVLGAIPLLTFLLSARLSPPLEAKVRIPIILKKTAGKVAAAITRKNKTAQGTVSSWRWPECRKNRTVHVGVLTLQIAGYHFIKFRVTCTEAIPPSLQVGDTVKIGYQGDGLIREVVSRIIRLGGHVDLKNDPKVISTLPGIERSAADCPTCGRSESGGPGYGG